MKTIIQIIIISLLITSCAVKITESKKIAPEDELKEMIVADQIAAYIP